MQVFMKVSVLALIGAFAASASAATSIDKLTIAPASGAKVGEKITATIEVSAPEGVCGMEVEFGDGTRQTFKIKPDTKLPIVVEHTYKKAKSYKIRAAGDKVENAFGCTGKQIVEHYKVEAAAAAPAAPTTPCPTDWVLQGKVAKDGSYTCVPKKGVKEVKKPEQPLACPAGTSYFTKGKTLGCEKG